MKKYIKSVFLMGMVIFHSAQVSASRDLGDLGRATLAAITSQVSQVIIAGGVTAAFFGGPEYRAKIAKDIETYLYSSRAPQTFPYKTYEELSLVGTSSKLHPTIEENISKKIKAKSPCNKTIVGYGPPGTGKTTTPEAIAALLEKAGQFDKLYTIRQDELTAWAATMFPEEKNIGKADLLCRFAEYFNKNTPDGKISIFDLEEVGSELIQVNNTDNKVANTGDQNPTASAWKGLTGKIKGDGGEGNGKFDKLIFYASSNDVNDQNINDAIGERVILAAFDKQPENERIELFKNGVHNNVQQNAQFHGDSQIKDKLFKMDTFTYLLSYIPFIGTDIHNNAQQAIRNKYQQHNFLTTPEMTKKAEDEFVNKLHGMNEKKESYEKGLTWFTWLDSKFNKQTHAQREIDKKNTWAQECKIRKFKAAGFATPTLTQNLNDMTKNDAQLLADKTNPILPADTSLTIEEKKKSIKRANTSLRCIDDNFLQNRVQDQKIELIVDIKEHLDTHGATITHQTDPVLWEKMNLERKYNSEILSTSTDIHKKKADAKLPRLTTPSYTINPDNRTYTFTAETLDTDDSKRYGNEVKNILKSYEDNYASLTPELKNARKAEINELAKTRKNVTESEPIEFGTVTKVDLFAAAYDENLKKDISKIKDNKPKENSAKKTPVGYGNLFKQYDDKDAAAKKIGQNIKSIDKAVFVERLKANKAKKSAEKLATQSIPSSSKKPMSLTSHLEQKINN